MNWFGFFTCASIVVAIVGRIVYEMGYERAESDWTVSKEWLDRLEMENNNWK